MIPKGIDHSEIVLKLSLNAQRYLYHVRKHLNGKAATTAQTSLKVDVVGGGICGLSTAVALSQTGHKVTVFEAAREIEALGAGIQIAPNATRQFRRWGLADHLDEIGVHPEDLITKRWNNGDTIGRFATRQLMDKFGSPFLQVHRGDLHDRLYGIACKHGVSFRPNCKVTSYCHETASFSLQTGEVSSADLVVVADGVRSSARKQIEGHGIEGDTHWVAYRASLPTTLVAQERDIAWMVENSKQLCWAGPGRHCVSYAVRADSLYNMVFIVPNDRTRDTSKYTDDLFKNFSTWDPRLNQLLRLISADQISKWPLWIASHPERWSKEMCRVILLGDAAHDMTPFLGQGAAMAVEDAACLEHILCAVRSSSEKEKRTDVLSALEILQAFRAPRVGQIRRQAEEVVRLRHLADGQEQESRDNLALRELQSEEPAYTPYIFTDPRGQEWLYGYDIVLAIKGLI